MHDLELQWLRLEKLIRLGEGPVIRMPATLLEEFSGNQGRWVLDLVLVI